MRGSHWKSSLTSSLFVLPYFLCFVAFLLIPIIYGIIISFQDFNLLSPVHKFVGLQNYKNIFNPTTYVHSAFFNGLWNTLQFVIYSVPALVLVGLALALLVNSIPKKVRGLFRTIFFTPYAISAAVMATIWLRIFDNNSGFINLTLKITTPWLTDLPWAWIALVMSTLWWTIGFNMIIFINALNQVPEEMYEAATLEGANAWKKLVSITLPSIKPVLLFVLITATIASFNVFSQPYLLTRGGPGDSTKVLLMSILDVAFGQQQVGAASAMAFFMAIIMIFISILQFRFNNSRKG